jgi:hypothetical protein
MNELGFVLSHYSAAGLLALISYIVGRRLLLRFSFNSVLEQTSFSVALGLGLIAYLVFFLGLVGLLYRWFVILALALVVAGCYPVWRSWGVGLGRVSEQIRNAKSNRVALVLALTASTFVLALPLFYLPLYPPTAFDETMYHLRVAREYVEHQGVVLTPFVRYPVFPQTNEMLFTLAILIYDDVLAHLVQFVLMLTLATSLVAFGRRFFSQRAGWWSAAILLSNPLVLWCGSVSYVEIALMLFIAMAVYAFSNWVESREQRWLIVAGTFCGFAVGTKYNALFFVGALQIAALYLGLNSRKYTRPLAFGLMAVLVAGPWFARNLYYARNPVFPYFYPLFEGLFGSGMLDPAQYVGMVRELSAHGVGRSLLSLALVPWHLTFNQQSFVMEAPLSSLHFFLLPFLAAGAFALARVRYLLVLIAAYTLFWFFSAQVLRYLLPALPLLSLATAAALSHLVNATPLLRRLNRFSMTTILGVGALISPGWIYARQDWDKRGVLPATQVQREAYLAARLPSYPAYAMLNRLKGSAYRLYAFHDEGMNYYAAGLFMGDWFGPARYEIVNGNLETGLDLYNQLKSMGADYFLRRAGNSVPELPVDEFFNSHFRPIYAQPGVVLYEVTERPFQ